MPGANATSASGVIDCGGKTITFGTTGALRINIRKAGTAEGSLGATGLQTVGGLTFKDGAKISIGLYSGYEPQEGDEIRIINGATNITGTPIVECDQEGLEFDTSRLAEGLLIVKAGCPYFTSIDRISADEEVEVEVVGINGALIDHFTSRMSDAESTLRKSSAPKGIYIINVRGKSAKGTIKVVK